MRGPDLAALRERIPSKYLLVTVTAKRARQLMEGSTPKTKQVEGKPVTVAMEEIAQGFVGPTPTENEKV